MAAGSLVDEGLAAGSVADQLLGLEPQVDLRLGVFQGVAAVDDVPAHTHTRTLQHSALNCWVEGLRSDRLPPNCLVDLSVSQILFLEKRLKVWL